MTLDEIKNLVGCDHWVVRHYGRLRCKLCRATMVLGFKGPEWRAPLTAAERGKMGGRPRKVR